MLPVAYTISDDLRSTLVSIETVRKSILVISLSPKSELRLRWDALVERTYATMILAGSPVPKPDVVKLLVHPPGSRRMSTTASAVTAYRRAYDAIASDWLVTNRPLTKDVMFELAQRALAPPVWRSSRRTATLLGTQLTQLTDYLNAQHEHPLIEAAILLAQLVHMAPFESESTKVALLATVLSLYRRGFDIRQLFILEWAWRRDPAGFAAALVSAKSGSYNRWFMYVTGTALTAMTKLEETVKHASGAAETDQFFMLSSRQSSILSFLAPPQSSVTNRAVQKSFGVSQITASRDLTRLAALGLVFAHGRGRSVYYTRV